MALSGHGQINPVQVFSGCLSENFISFFFDDLGA